MTNTKIEFSAAKKKIAVLWFIFVGCIFVLMFIQTMTGKYEDKDTEAWGWLFPSVIPTLSLILSVFLFDIQSEDSKVFNIDRFYFRLVFFLSIFYLSVILLILLIQPLLNDQPLISLMKNSSIYLGPFQGVISGAMGLFFIKKK